MLQRLLTILLSGFLLTSCANDEPTTNGSEEDSKTDNGFQTDTDRIENLIVGNWHYYDGIITKESSENEQAYLIDKLLEFTPSHNYSEAVTWGLVNRQLNVEDEKQIGNWHLSDDKLILSDWYGANHQTYTISQITENSLFILDAEGNSVEYKRAGTEYEELETALLGYWYPYPRTQRDDFYHFKDDGFVTIRTWMNVAGSPMPMHGDSKWNLSETVVAITTYPVDNRTDYYPVKCCNTTFLMMGNLILKRTKWH